VGGGGVVRVIHPGAHGINFIRALAQIFNAAAQTILTDH
jgi:hypothetical protein